MYSDSNTTGTSDISDANFSILQSTFPTITLSHPNGRERLPVDTSIIIDWVANFNEGTLLLEINRNFPSGEWSTIATTPVMTRGYSWTVNGPVSELCRIRVTLEDSGFAPVFDISDANFAIVGTPNPAITVVASEWR